ncbi:MAG: SCO family protein [Anaerolineales bacterium]
MQNRAFTLFSFAALVAVIGVALALLAMSISDADEATTEDDALVSVLIDEGDTASGGVSAAGYRGAAFDPPITIADWSLPATTGRDYVFSEQAGTVQLIYFGYMSCPDFCPTTMADLQRAFVTLGDDLTEHVQVVFVTVDPARDDLTRMARYVSAFNDDFIGLRGEDGALQTVMGEFGAVARQREVDSAMGYLVDHTASVFMVDPEGQLVGRFVYGTPSADIAHDVRLVLEAHGLAG